MYHAAGLYASLYKPIQWIFHTDSRGWPALVSTCLLYLASAILFECSYRYLRDIRPK